MVLAISASSVELVPHHHARCLTKDALKIQQQHRMKRAIILFKNNNIKKSIFREDPIFYDLG